MIFRRFDFDKDADVIWEILHLVIESGDTLVFAPDSSKEKMLNYWGADDKFAYICEIENEVVGTFYIKANQPDLGSHVANAGYLVHPMHRGKGIAEAMCRFSLEEAKRLDFKAMQFNIVISTNEVAVRLWQKCGFEIVGRIPKAFQHQKLGLVDAFVMYQWLE
ncbi:MULTISPECIES: GNAT family N-acetyltransferase [Emticicia]|uniref:GNAT family N-acetyltransferase n=1 Tax=Emticicia TaxID=312278 RepID=UPI0007D8BF50|nr:MULTISPECIES: GNAT family N-acetyltransferase [Emticicia]